MTHPQTRNQAYGQVHAYGKRYLNTAITHTTSTTVVFGDLFEAKVSSFKFHWHDFRA